MTACGDRFALGEFEFRCDWFAGPGLSGAAKLDAHMREGHHWSARREFDARVNDVPYRAEWFRVEA